VELPYPLDVLFAMSSESSASAVAAGYQPLILPVRVGVINSSGGNEIDINVQPLSIRNLYDILHAGLTSRLLTHLTLKGCFIWGRDDPTMYLDGKAFGIARKDPDGVHIGLRLPKSGNGTPGSDFEMWFWLVRPVLANSVTFSPNPVIAGQPANGTVTLNGFAPPGGALITLSGNNPSIGTIVPTSVTIQEGQLTGPFTVTNTSVPAGAASASLQVTATYAESTSSAVGTLVINQQVALTGLAFNPNPIAIIAGTETSAGTLTLSGPAPAGGAVIALSGNQPNVAPVPASVTIAANQTSATFTVRPARIAIGVVLQVTASYAGRTVQATLTINALQ
jgi:hypothetical protein